MNHDPLFHRADLAHDTLQATSQELRDTIDDARRRVALFRQQRMMDLLSPSDRQWLAVRMKLEAGR